MYVIDTCGYSLSEAYTFPYSHYNDLSDCRNFSRDPLDGSDLWKRCFIFYSYVSTYLTTTLQEAH